MRKVSHKFFFVFALALVLLIPSLLYLAKNNPSISGEPEFSRDSSIIRTANTTTLLLRTDKGYLYKTTAKGFDSAIEFVTSNPTYHSLSYIPPNFVQNSTLVSNNTTPRAEAKAIDPTVPTEQYLFNQLIKGIPVYRAQLAIHLRNGNEIYAVEGKLVQNQEVQRQQISQAKAEGTAMQLAKRQSPRGATLIVEHTDPYIFNKKILGLDKDERNFLTLGITIKNINIATKPFKKRYFVDLTTGTILSIENIDQNTRK